jgi:DNA repair exonuclease SbcCD ATPase subunit
MVSFSNSVKFNDKISEDGQSQVQDEIKVTSDHVSRGRDEVEQRQDTFHKSLIEEKFNRIHLDRTNTYKEDEQVTVNSHNLTDSQLDAVPSYTRSKAFHGLNDGLDLLFKNDMAFNNNRGPILNERNDQNSILSNDVKRKNNDLFQEKHHTMQAQPTLKSASVNMLRNDLHQQSFPRSNLTQNQMNVPLASQESIESAWNLVREETSTMIAQVMQHLDANSSLLQKIQETQSSAQAVDESTTIKNDWFQELRKHTAYVEDLCKGDKQQLNQTLARLDELLNYMNSATREDKTRLQEELSRISKLDENLAEERKHLRHNQEVERKRMMEDRVAFEQWKHQIEEELRRERESIQRRDELLTERENELNRQYADMKLNMQTLQYEKVSWRVVIQVPIHLKLFATS